MNERLIEHIHAMFEQAACALFAAATAFAVYRGFAVTFGQVQLDTFGSFAGAISYLLCRRALIRPSSDRPHFPIAAFEAAQLETLELDELVLTQSDMVNVAGPTPIDQDPLVLDDILAELGPDSRVVRLFDRSAMPTPARLKARIDDHLEQGSSQFIAPDASQALSDALAELRRSLR